MWSPMPASDRNLVPAESRRADNIRYSAGLRFKEKGLKHFVRLGEPDPRTGAVGQRLLGLTHPDYTDGIIILQNSADNIGKRRGIPQTPGKLVIETVRTKPIEQVRAGAGFIGTITARASLVIGDNNRFEWSAQHHPDMFDEEMPVIDQLAKLGTWINRARSPLPPTQTAMIAEALQTLRPTEL